MTWSALFESRRFLIGLVAVWACVYLTHLGTRPLRLEEGRRATPGREMAASGDFVRPTLYGDTYLNKPPLIFWIIAAVGSASGGVTPFAARLPSALAALGCAVVAYRFAPQDLDRRARGLAAGFVLSSATLLDKGTLGEIDAVLSFFVSLALKLWWDGHRRGGSMARTWFAVGGILGLAILLKGPAGPAIFYLSVGTYLTWRRRTRDLVSWCHLLGIIVAITPAAAWVGSLLDRGIVTAPELLGIWSHQVGATGVPGQVEPVADRAMRLVQHYVEFPVQFAMMCFPAVLWLRPAIRIDGARDLKCFLIAAVIGPAIAFYLYPESRPRHLMPAFFAVAVLGALGADRGFMPRTVAQVRWGLALVPAAVGLTGLGFVAAAAADAWVTASAVVLFGFAASGVAVVCHRRDADGPALAGPWLVAVLTVWVGMSTLVLPCLAARSPVTQAVAAAREQIEAGETVYTTRRFPVTGEGLYNVQFHLADEVHAADLDRLRQVSRGVAIVTPDEFRDLEADGLVRTVLGEIPGRGSAGPVVVIRIEGRPIERKGR